MNSSHVLNRLDVSTGARRRAESEPFDFEIAPCGVRVTNHSYEYPNEHAYIVTVADGIPVTCECPADEHYEPTCKHRLAVAIRDPVLEAATTGAVADGGTHSATPTDDDYRQNEEDSEEDDDDTSEWCDCAGLEDDFPCFECFRRGQKQLPEDM